MHIVVASWVSSVIVSRLFIFLCRLVWSHELSAVNETQRLYYNCLEAAKIGIIKIINKTILLCLACRAKSPLLTSSFSVSIVSVSFRLISPFPIELIVAC